ncbi:SRPBCC domain-containing protein [Dactylosporangium sp. NBC_01737]|uniref:SRPBCC family protein n=1 Tax=Dactylosporangium sp. NBC_01737 TaxID=2975959 RepID=UPI002E0D4FC0|nr:SRPBCC domain-containing protein [Dactylosporangium sp. NBC_01737]
MTEIRVDVDLEHPPPSVWRALTEAHLVTDWLPTTRFMVRDDGTFTFQAGTLAGLEDPIEGEIVTTEAPHRMVMRWSGENLHTVVALTLDERPGGTRLTLTQSGFLGPQGTMRRRVLRSTYQQLFEGPMAATLARQAAADPPPVAPTITDPPATVRRNDGGPFNRLPRQLNSPSRSAPGLSSQVRSTAGPRPTTTMPGFAAAVLGARATGVAAVPAARTAPSSSTFSSTSLTADAPVHRPTHRRGPGATLRRLGAAVRAAAIACSASVRRSWRHIATARDWSADRRSQAVAAAAAILLLLAMIALLVGKATAPHPAKPPRTGGGVEGPAQATVPAAPAERPRAPPWSRRPPQPPARPPRHRPRPRPAPPRPARSSPPAPAPRTSPSRPTGSPSPS